MPKIVALDIGGKRTGVAITDDLQIIASGLTTIETSSLISLLEDLFSKEDVESLVIGEPKHLNGQETDATAIVQAETKKIKQKFPNLPIHFVDERFTSKIAKQSILQSGAKKKKRQDKALVDKVSAVLILQSFLETNSKNL